MNDHGLLADLFRYVSAETRICPRPMEWQALWEQLPNARRTDRGWQPAPPLVLAAWWSTDNSAKAARLREHIEWAVKQGELNTTDRFLRGLSLEQWHHSDRSKPNY